MNYVAVLSMQDHINGKQYVGWKKIREKLKELEPTYGPSSRSGLGADRGGNDRDSDFRRNDNSDRGSRRNTDDRHGACLHTPLAANKSNHVLSVLFSCVELSHAQVHGTRSDQFMFRHCT